MRFPAALACLVVLGCPAAAFARIGGGPLHRSDCYLEFEGISVSNPTARPPRVECVEGDPCDQDGVCGNGYCVFPVQLCINQRDPENPSCTPPPGGLDLVRVLPPWLSDLREGLDLKQSMCGDVVGVPVALRATPGRPAHPGRLHLRAFAHTTGVTPTADPNFIVLRCLPRPADRPCPTGTTTTTTPPASTTTTSTSTSSTETSSSTTLATTSTTSSTVTTTTTASSTSTTVTTTSSTTSTTGTVATTTTSTSSTTGTVSTTSTTETTATTSTTSTTATTVTTITTSTTVTTTTTTTPPTVTTTTTSTTSTSSSTSTTATTSSSTSTTVTTTTTTIAVTTTTTTSTSTSTTITTTTTVPTTTTTTRVTTTTTTTTTAPGLGPRTFSITGATGDHFFTSALSGGDAAKAGSFNGKIMLTAGAIGSDGVRPLSVAANSFLGFQVLDNSFLCIRIDAAGSAGKLDCDGGTKVDIGVSADSHGAAANGPVTLVIEQGSAGPAGAAYFTANLRIVNCPGDPECTGTITSSADCPTKVNFDAATITPTPVAFTTGTATATILNRKPGSLGNSTPLAKTGQPFSCTNWTENGPGILEWPQVAFDNGIAGDTMNVYQFDD